MHLADLIGPEAVIASLKVKTKKQLLQELSARAARLTGLQERYVFDTLLQRERLGSTGLGQGIAIPHGKFAGLKRITGILRAPWRARRFRGGGRAARRHRVPAARPGRRRSRSSQGARAHLAAVARGPCRGQAQGLARCRGDLCGSDRGRHVTRRLTTACLASNRNRLKGRQCTLKGTRSFSIALAMAALRLSVSASGVPSAPSTA